MLKIRSSPCIYGLLIVLVDHEIRVLDLLFNEFLVVFFARRALKDDKKIRK